MGYDIHITRAENWAENEECWITPEEWDAVIRADPELRFCPENGGHFAGWTSDKAEEGAWLDWREGDVYTKNPSEALIRKMCDIASRLNANVQGDDGERYPEALEVRTSEPRSFAMYSLMFSAAAVANLMLAVWLDQNHAPGTPRSLAISFAVVVPMALGVMAWFIGALLACGSWFVGPKNRRLSIIASAVSVAFVLVLLVWA